MTPIHRLLKIFRDCFAIDLRSLAALRIVTAAVLLIDLAIRACDLSAHYTDVGVFPRERVFLDEGASFYPLSFVSLHLMSGHWTVQALLFAFHALTMLAMLVGYRTRLATVLCWAMWISLLARNTAVLQGSDHLLKLVLFWGIFLPWGAVWSVDSLRRPSQPSLPSRVFHIATVGYLLQICFVYLFAVLWKTGAEWRTDFTATYYALSLDQFSTYLGQWLLRQRALLVPLTAIAFWVEAVGPLFLLFPYFKGRIRTVAVFSFMGMHISYGLCLALGNFSWACCAALVGFFPGEFWDWIETRSFWPRTARVRTQATEKLGRWFSRWKTESLSLEPSPWANAIAALALVSALTWNIAGLPPLQSQFSPAVRAPASVLHVDQHWGMFAPFPFKDDGWFVIDAKLRNQNHVDLFRGGKPVDFSKPAHVSSEYPNGRWRKFMLNLWELRNQSPVASYAPYLCRQWNTVHLGTDQVEEFEIFFVKETTLPNFRTAPPEKVSLWKHYCFMAPRGFASKLN